VSSRNLPRSQKNKPAHHGFSLAELFIALTIFSFLSLSLMYALNISLQVYKREKSKDISAINTKTTIGIMEREIQRAVAFNNIRLVGTSKQIYFYAPSPFPDLDYALNKVTYQVKELENKQIVIEKRAENPFAPVLEGETPQKGYVYSYYFSPATKDITFGFLTPPGSTQEEGEAGEESAKSSWAEDYFPAAIKVHFAYSEGLSEKTYDAFIVMPHVINYKAAPAQ
jgi:hypothetical protein